MTGSPSKFLAGLLACLFVPLAAHAQGAAAPAMYDVHEVVLQPIHFGNDKVAVSCGLTAEDLSTAVLKVLNDGGVPVTYALDAKPSLIGRARIDLVPDIYTLNSQGLDCTSWVSLTAQTHNSVHVPPVDLARNVAVVYWHEGSLLASGQTTHEHVLIETLQKLGKHFVQQYKLDQPGQDPEKK